MVSAVVAVDNNWGIGFQGKLLEHIPEDLKYFKELTTGHVVVMGRKTWDSLPNKPLPNRQHVIITREDHPLKDQTVEHVFLHLDTVERWLKTTEKEAFIIGGGQIYKALLPFCDRVYVTKIYKDHENVDTYFPNLDNMEEWAPATCSAIYDYNGLSYQFWQYDRIS